MDLLDTLNPICIYVGTQELVEKLEQLNMQSILNSWFEDGGFAVVLKVPSDMNVD